MGNLSSLNSLSNDSHLRTFCIDEILNKIEWPKSVTEDRVLGIEPYTMREDFVIRDIQLKQIDNVDSDSTTITLRAELMNKTIWSSSLSLTKTMLASTKSQVDIFSYSIKRLCAEIANMISNELNVLPLKEMIEKNICL